jgi:hypothetical protein
MKERKILRVLEKFSVAELNSFRKFLVSPFFNQNERIIALFDLIDDYVRNKKDFYELSNEQLWEKVHGNLKDFTEIRLRKLFSDIFALSEEYMAHVEFSEEKSFKLSMLFKAYKNRGLRELYPTIINDTTQIEKIHKNKNAEFYLHKYMHQRSIMEFNLEGQILARNEDLEKKLNVEEVSYNLDVFYIAEKLKYYCNILSFNRSYKINKKIIGIEIILKLAQSEVFKDYPPIAVYYTISKTITEENNEAHYYKLKELINEYLHLFTEKEAKEIFESALNYCVTKGNKGNVEFEKEALTLFKYGLKNNLLFDKEKYMPPGYFRNIVFYSLRQSEYDWAEKFIDEFGSTLNPSIRESNVNFSLARIEMYKKNYSKVIELLAYTEYTEVFQALLSRNLLLAAYYELKEVDSLESLLNSFKLYLDREKSYNKERKTQYYNLIKFTRTLLNLTKKDKDKLQALKEEIEKAEAVVNKAWLLEKVGEKL